MKKATSVLIIVLLFISCTKKIYNSSSWQSKTVIVDGNIPEWPDPLRFYDQEIGLSYSISNDKFNLYFCCSISNEYLQTKILRSGIELGIDTLGKKTFAVGMRYPTGNSSEIEPATNISPLEKTDTKSRPDHSSFKLKLLAEAREIQLTGFKPYLGKFISLSPSNVSGISAAISFNKQGFMNYEAVIPFSTFYKKELTPADSNRVFNFQIKISKNDRSDNSGAGGNQVRGGGMNSGGMHGGGMRGGGMHGGGGMRGGGMRGGEMGGGERSGENGGNHYQRNANNSGTTKTTVKLKLAFR